MKKQFSAEEINAFADFIDDNIYLVDYEKWISFTVNLSDCFSETLNIDIFDAPHKEKHKTVQQYVHNHLHTLAVAIIRLYDNDRKRLNTLSKNFGKEQRKYIKSTIKNRKSYEE